MTCEQALQLLAAHLDHELGEQKAEHVQQHLHRCQACYSRAEFERKLKLQLAELRSATVSTGLEQRIRNLLQTFGPAST